MKKFNRIILIFSIIIFIFYSFTLHEDLTINKDRIVICGGQSVYVKLEDNIAIGTLTFYDYRTDYVSMFGHGYCVDNKLVDLKDLNVFQSEIISINKSEPYSIGSINNVENLWLFPFGKVIKNSDFGVYSTISNFSSILDSNKIKIGNRNQVNKGDAYLLTTVNGNKVKKYKIKILKINNQNTPAPKGIRFKVVDNNLIKNCGGIVRGMSGSPIIQNDKLIGALTHVDVENPIYGYGVYADWLINECDNGVL